MIKFRVSSGKMWTFLRFYMITLKEKVKTAFSSKDASQIFNLSLEHQIYRFETFSKHWNFINSTIYWWFFKNKLWENSKEVFEL